MISKRRVVHALSAHLWIGAFFLMPGYLVAAQFHVTPSGTAGGKGTLAHPWSLPHAFSHPPLVRAGDTIWVHGGVYRGVFQSRLRGTKEKPVIVRQFPGERATLDNVDGVKELGLHLEGGYTWYWGLEVRNTSTAPWNIAGVAMDGPGQKLINMIIHDNLSTGLTSYSTAPDAEVYGCLIYYNGRQTEDPDGRGYGIYTQNNSGRLKSFRENVIPFSWSWGIHAYTEGNRIDHFFFEGNVIFNSGILWRGSQFERNFFMGSTKVSADFNTFKENYSYYPAFPADGARNTFGYFAGTTSLVLSGNWFVGGAFDVSGVDPMIKGNTFHRTSGYQGEENTYLTSPAGRNVFVRPNVYDRGRANIIIFNWDTAKAVKVDVSKSGLCVGERFEVRDALCWFGEPVTTGTYTGEAISVPMVGLSAATPVGSPAVQPKHTAPQFGVFIIQKKM